MNTPPQGIERPENYPGEFPPLTQHPRPHWSEEDTRAIPQSGPRHAGGGYRDDVHHVGPPLAATGPNTSAPRRKRSGLKTVAILFAILAALAVLVSLLAVACAPSATPPALTTPTWSPAPEPTSSAVPRGGPAATVPAPSTPGPGAVGEPGGNAGAAGGPVGVIEPGTWSVPDEVKAGVYRSAGPEDSTVPLCYVDTTPAAGGNIIAQEVSNGGPVRIRVKVGQIVKTSGCKTFVKVG